MKDFEVCGVRFGKDDPPVIVAEIGINHGGDVGVAIKMAQAAMDAGAHLIKHQTHIASAEMSAEAIGRVPGNSSKNIFEIISECQLSESEELELKKFVEDQGGVFFSTPFSREAFWRLEAWDVPLYKIGSGECNNYPFVEMVASAGKPVILSTGMNSISSIKPSVEILRGAGCEVVLLHTTNLYPTPANLIRLGAIDQLRRAFPDVLLGLSDHSLTNGPAIASVAMGARVLERHFTDDKSRSGPDISCSMDPHELRELVVQSAEVFRALGGSKTPAKEEDVTINFAFSSVVATQDILPGAELTRENIWVKRPAGGDFGPRDFPSLLGRRASRVILNNHQVSMDALEEAEQS